jgi:hypothetical protein
MHRPVLFKKDGISNKNRTMDMKVYVHFNAPLFPYFDLSTNFRITQIDILNVFLGRNKYFRSVNFWTRPIARYSERKLRLRI